MFIRKNIDSLCIIDKLNARVTSREEKASKIKVVIGTQISL